ncbi:MAG: protease complex subunit PrcB family protein [Lachnospiraceae bacterium]|nr:protease complex subunit PrcB family protein [Lachnospiraceae bacterium]
MSKKTYKLVHIIMLAAFLVASLVGCEFNKNSEKKVRDLDYLVCDERGLPHELTDIINDKKKEPCKFTYRTNDYLYIVVGYGAQDRRDLNVVVSSLYLTENAIYVETDLTSDDNVGLEKGLVSYPWIAVKIENYDLPVNFG